MTAKERLQHLQLQDLGLPMFNLIDTMSKEQDRDGPAALIMLAIAIADKDGDLNDTLTTAVRAYKDAKLQETEHYKALRDVIAHEV
jgi:hypothetical protein